LPPVREGITARRVVNSTPRRWRRRNTWLLLAALAVAAVLACVLWWWLHRSTVRYVTAKVTIGDIRRSVAMTGSLNPVVTAQVGSYVSGNIKSWSCDYNTLVKIGQRCALIDPLPFQVVVDQDQADVTVSKAQLVKDRAALVDAKVTYERDSKLLDQGIVSQAQIDTDKSTFDQAKAQIDLDIATIADKKAVLKAAEVNLAYTNIVSPVNGMVITRYIDIGQTVVSSLQSSTLFLIGRDMTKMQVDTNVSEADVGDVRAGQQAYFTVQAFPNRVFWGTVRQVRVGPITVQNVVTYDVVVDVDNQDLALFPGMTADAHIITAEHKNVLRVPLPATRFVPEGMSRRERDTADSSDDSEPPEAPARQRRESGADGTRPQGAGRREGAGRPDGGARTAGAGQSDGSTRRAGHRARGPAARIWLLVNGALQQVRVQTGLDDGVLIEVAGPGLKVGDEVVVNAMRPDAPRSAVVAEPGQRAAGGQAPRQNAGGPRF
jgi:HlyD family secretion protein